MSKRLLSRFGMILFILGFLLIGAGAFIVWGVSWGGGNPLLLPGIGFVLILCSFVLLSLGSRVGDSTE